MARKIDENIVNDTIKSDKKKKCFVITPIGEENSLIRRDIDGLLESVIQPVFKDLDICEPEVSHKSVIPGSISKSIINSIYSADFIIANLTGLNPNVMYELGFAHSARKPVIHIAKRGEKLPFDIIDQRTLFYDNDMKGVVILKQELKDMVSQVMKLKFVDENPIIDGVKTFQFVKPEGKEIDINEAMINIYRKLDDLSYRVDNSRNYEEFIIRNINKIPLSEAINNIDNYDMTFLNLTKDLGRVPSFEEFYSKYSDDDLLSINDIRRIYSRVVNNFKLRNRKWFYFLLTMYIYTIFS